MAASQLDQMKQQFEIFKTGLSEFAVKYKKEIQKEPQFRQHFQKMCLSIGVDPLASNKGVWANILGVGDFYYELGIQIIEICIGMRETNGGLVEFDILKRRLCSIKKSTDISDDDIVRAIKMLKPLGNGFDIIQIGSTKLVQSVPKELSNDYVALLKIAQENKGKITGKILKEHLKWETDRIQACLTRVLQDGIMWIDYQETPPSYYALCYFDSL